MRRWRPYLTVMMAPLYPARESSWIAPLEQLGMNWTKCPNSSDMKGTVAITQSKEIISQPNFFTR
ncbi:MAG: hypothetical protein ACXABI_09300 [Candidatus Hodarchaeales archaeon]|jgi:hypothetical protein